MISGPFGINVGKLTGTFNALWSRYWAGWKSHRYWELEVLIHPKMKLHGSTKDAEDSPRELVLRMAELRQRSVTSNSLLDLLGKCCSI
jgi:hypothetical protein